MPYNSSGSETHQVRIVKIERMQMKELRLKDLYLIAFLVNEEQNLIRMESEGQKCWFIFDETDRLNELIGDYWSGRAITNIKNYVDKVRDLKDRIFSER